MKCRIIARLKTENWPINVHTAKTEAALFPGPYDIEDYFPI